MPKPNPAPRKSVVEKGDAPAMGRPMKLTHEQFIKAKNYLLGSGRPLEQALFRHHLEDGPADEVLSALEKHQTDSGGFLDTGEGGPDHPSPIGSTIAFQHLVDIGAGADCALVEAGIGYFLATYDREHEAWPQTVEQPEFLERDLPEHWGNPSAEIVGYLWRYRELVPDDFLTQVTRVAMRNFRGLAVPVPGFADLCFVRCARFVPPQYRDEIIQKVRAGVRANLLLDHKKWATSYFIKPYWYAMTPQESLYALLRDEIESCLDVDVATQEPEGNFRLTFSVTGRAEHTWKSIWTLEVLRVLKAYGRIEGVNPAR